MEPKSASGLTIATLAAAAVAATSAAAAYRVVQQKHTHAEHERQLTDFQREELREFARRVAEAESGLGPAGNARLGRVLRSVRARGNKTKWLSLRLQALSGKANMDKAVLAELRDVLKALIEEDILIPKDDK
jgi:hypothetical protein